MVDRACVAPDLVARAGVFGGHWGGSGPVLESVNPSTGEVLGRVKSGTVGDYEECMTAMARAAHEWSRTPAPRRGAVVRRMGVLLRERREALGELVSLEVGKVRWACFVGAAVVGASSW